MKLLFGLNEEQLNMPHVLPISKLRRKSKAELLLVFCSVWKYLIYFKWKNKYWKMNGEARVQTVNLFLQRTSLRYFQCFFLLFLLSANGSLEIYKKWCLTVPITGQLAFHRLKLETTDIPRICFFSSLHLKVQLSHLFLTSLFLIPFIFPYIPFFKRESCNYKTLQKL